MAAAGSREQPTATATTSDPACGSAPAATTPRATGGIRHAPGYPAPGYGAPPVLVAVAKPPRPASPIGGGLMIAGAIIAAIGCFLPWLTIADATSTASTRLR